MKCGYDNFEDAKSKLVGTYCYYNGKAFYVKAVGVEGDAHDNGKYKCIGSYIMSGREVTCSITDPLFNCADYNIGYINNAYSAVWFYRIPMKQYKQGLRQDQVNCKASNPNWMDGGGFKQGKNLGKMLENDYPKFRAAVELLREEQVTIVAFHKNFAMTHDKIHGDFILEYKGQNIGYTKNLEDFTLVKGQGHLIEALKEAVQA